jgi:outer membrane receptor protein involved in Fe transport
MRGVLIFLTFLTTAAAQVGSASLAGTVVDPSSGTIAGASLTIVNTATGFTRHTVSSSNGSYRFDALQPGNYTVTARKVGFAEYQAQTVILQLDQSARLDILLSLAAAGRENVTVSGVVSPVQTETAAIGYRMDESRISDLPLASRNVISLVTLGPGAIPRQLGGFVHDVNNDVQEGSRGSVAFNPPVNGSRSTMNAFLLDGIYNTDRNTFALAIHPPMESVQEFHIESSLAAAEFPQAGGAAIDVLTKSGGKMPHGSAFEYFRNEAADARNYFDDPSLPRPIFRQSELGGSLGGPVPHLKNTFFYGAYEAHRQKSGTSAAAIVPDAATRAGNFAGQNRIFDPLASRTPFPGNQIPAARLDSVATTFLSRFEPLPNTSGAAGNYLDATPNTKNNDSVLGRFDHQFGPRGILTGRYTYNGEANRIAGSFPLLPFSEQVRAQQAAVTYIAAGASWMDESRFAFTRLRLYDVPETAFHDNVARDLGLANPPTDPLSFGLPYFNATNYSMVTDSPTLPQVQRDNLWQLSSHVSLLRGRHTLKMGGDWLHFQLNYLQSNLTRGEYTYTGVFTSVDGSGTGSGDPFADFLLGYPQLTTRTSGSGQGYLRQNVYAGFAQDSWRFTPRLTLMLGLRYEYAAPYTEARDRLLNLDYSTLPNPPRLVPVSAATAPDRNNFAPRVGLAWEPPRVRGIFRAGYGIYFSPEIAVETYDLILNHLLTELNETQGDRLPVLTTRDGFPKTSASGFPSYFGLDPRARTPYVQQWNSTFQRELSGKAVLEIAYVGSKGTKLGRYRQFNTPAHVETGENLPPRPGDLQQLRTFPSLGKIIQRQHIANSSYHSLQIKLERNLSARLSLLASFVWSKSIDDADSVIPGLFDSVGAQDERNLRLERGLSFFNSGRRVSAGYVLRLPAAHFGGRFLSHWLLSGTVTLQDGTPLNPFYFALDFANSGTPNRPNLVPGQSISLPRSRRTADQFFNTAAFSAPAPYTFGNAGRNIIPGPGNNIFDLALHRQFPVREGHRVSIRVESFNTFNHPNWGIPGPNPDFGPFFGKIFSSGEPRRLQLALRYDF